ncbi:copper amine oxidase N-terminal domain-containing protein [Cellulosilyticum sp. I15G10I2]|uniref:copper amine oxidase N-terminal domain-containing protein n=1 Tax=Cellulosilyticum sp. I15G10I2 TaxID=1892843 RepID=UPI00085CCF6E|nr:copper amine oxidase N-terminal domain-containing protein [Cellulosilyticum sp. I15G10I2]
MRIRQKIAMLLAAAMTLTAMPMVTMAQTKNQLTTGIKVGEKGDKITAATLVITPEAPTPSFSTGTFFVNLTNAKWVVTPSNTANATFYKNDDTQLQVVVSGTVNSTNTIDIPLKVELTGGDATVAINGNGTAVNDMAEVVFARTSDAKATVTAGDAKNISFTGAIADITIQEPFKGNLDTKKITVTLENTDYEFVNANGGTIKLSGGFGAINSVTATAVRKTSDAGVVEITLSQKSSVAPGRMVLEGWEVRSKSRSIKVDDAIEVTVSGDNVNETTLKVGVAKEVGSTLEMKDKKVVDVVAGREAKVTFSIKENVGDTFISNRDVEINADKGYFWNKTKVKDTAGEADKVIAAIRSTLEISKMGATPVVEKGADAIDGNISLLYDNDDDQRVVGFYFTTANKDFRKADIDEITFKDLKVWTPVNVEGDIKLTAEGRTLGEKLEVVALNAKAPVTITSEELTVKTGLKAQVGGKVTLTETDKGMLKQNELLEFTVDGRPTGFTFSDKPVVKVVSGDVQIGEIKKTDSTITVEIKRASKTASVIEISAFPVNVDRTIPEGKYDLKINGLAVEPDTYTLKGDLTVKGFINSATPNTEDITANGLRKGTSAFVIGSSKYVVNGIESEMDGAAYIENGRTMVPVRYVANALGVASSDIYFANGTATVIAGTKTVSLTLGDKVAKLNGVPAKVMVAAPVLKDGRTYVPVSEIGALLGVEATWDAATQTATFTNK